MIAKKKLIIRLFYFSILYLSCKNTDNSASIMQDSARSAVKNDTQALQSKSADNGKNGEDEDMDKIISNYIKKYKTPFLFDSIYAIGNDSFDVSLTHYCLMDSAIKIPKRYLRVYNLDSFITHNFETALKVKKNGKMLLDKKITKNDFGKYLYPDLKNYGVLFYPEIRLDGSSFNIDYSISIPLTDVGIGIIMKIDKDGKIDYIAR